MFIKTDGGGETSLADVALVNNGTIDVRSGSIRLPNDFDNDGTLAGTGAFTVDDVDQCRPALRPAICRPAR